MARRFVTLDVFTDRKFAGNPLADNALSEVRIGGNAVFVQRGEMLDWIIK